MAGGARILSASIAGYAVHVEYRPPVDKKAWLPVNRFGGCARVGVLGATRHSAPKQLAARCAEVPEALVGLVGAVVLDSLSRRFTTSLESLSGIVTVRSLGDTRAWWLV